MRAAVGGMNIDLGVALLLVAVQPWQRLYQSPYKDVTITTATARTAVLQGLVGIGTLVLGAILLIRKDRSEDKRSK